MPPSIKQPRHRALFEWFASLRCKWLPWRAQIVPMNKASEPVSSAAVSNVVTTETRLAETQVIEANATAIADIRLAHRKDIHPRYARRHASSPRVLRCWLPAMVTNSVTRELAALAKRHCRHLRSQQESAKRHHNSRSPICEGLLRSATLLSRQEWRGVAKGWPLLLARPPDDRPRPHVSGHRVNTFFAVRPKVAKGFSA